MGQACGGGGLGCKYPHMLLYIHTLTPWPTNFYFFYFFSIYARSHGIQYRPFIASRIIVIQQLGVNNIMHHHVQAQEKSISNVSRSITRCRNRSVVCVCVCGARNINPVQVQSSTISTYITSPNEIEARSKLLRRNRRSRACSDGKEEKGNKKDILTTERTLSIM